MFMKVKVKEQIKFPGYGWVSARLAGPQHGRMLIIIEGHSGASRWTEGLITAPENIVIVEEEIGCAPNVILSPGTYEVQEGEDKRGKRLLRFYTAEATAETTLILFTVPGFLIPEASSKDVIVLLEAEGHSRTGRSGGRLSLIAAPTEAVIAVEPYDDGSEINYYRISQEGVETICAIIDVVLAPEEW